MDYLKRVVWLAIAGLIALMGAKFFGRAAAKSGV